MFCYLGTFDRMKILMLELGQNICEFPRLESRTQPSVISNSVGILTSGFWPHPKFKTFSELALRVSVLRRAQIENSSGSFAHQNYSKFIKIFFVKTNNISFFTPIMQDFDTKEQVLKEKTLLVENEEFPATEVHKCSRLFNA